ncbi:hypothetical protein [Nocardioides sp. SYSU D00038]|uniref:hypothetical protein n=1 Tax=Nocardioides sp. SYSU D00038 TaxID=2812554 RepID=UPI0019688498|nr:hypothetical protein [Nocardioides sp. SYSU D00038]
MRARLLDLCLLAYPRAVRERDGDHLRDLADELADDHGFGREAAGLLWAGLAERRRRARTGRALVASVAAVLLVVSGLAWTAAAQGGRAEEDLLGCAGRCPEVEAEVAARVSDGWTCTERREPTGAGWRCVRD